MDTPSDGPLSFSGYASTTGTAYQVNDFLGSYQETIERGAFDKTLAEGDDVRLLINHEGLPLARYTGRGISNGDTMSLSTDASGLLVDAALDRNDPDVQRIEPKMRRGDLSQMSIGFQVTRQDWSKDYTERTIREVKLFDVSVVTYPANPATSAQVRSHLERVGFPIERLAAVTAELRAGAVLSSTSLMFLAQALECLSDASEDIGSAQDALVDLMQSAGVLPDVGDDNPDGTEMDDPAEMPARSAYPLSSLKFSDLARDARR
jgi:HK97 family phage prohead protease